MKSKQVHLRNNPLNFPWEAIESIDEILDIGQQKGYADGFWRTLTWEHHMKKALGHLDRVGAPNSNEDHLAHALTRLAMAVAVRENVR